MFTLMHTKELARSRVWSQAPCRSEPPCVKQQPSSTLILNSSRLAVNFFEYGVSNGIFTS